MNKKKQNKKIIGKTFVFIIVFILIVITRIENTNNRKNIEDNKHGSAERLEGTTIIYSIFASDNNYTWNFKKKEDLDTRNSIRNNLRIATNYLSTEAKKYNKEAKFIYDFTKDENLMKEEEFKCDLENQTDHDNTIWKFIEKKIDVNNLIDSYKADNIIFFVLINTDEKCKAITCTRDWYNEMPYPYEMVYLYNIDYGFINPPSVYAHEMLHTFGAFDYYEENSDLNVTKKTVNYLKKHMSNDIMLTCSDTDGKYRYDVITNEIGEMTAYYIGLQSKPNVVKELNLIPSQHK